MADQTGALEDIAKKMDGKNAITLFDEENVYHWEVLIEKVLGEKFLVIDRFFENNEDRGKNFLYHLLDLLRNMDEPINIARLAYLLARMEPDEKADQTQQQLYKEFSRKIFEWARDDTERSQVITAIYIYVYLNRKEENEE
jgi:CRISPR-associated protein Csm1